MAATSSKKKRSTKKRAPSKAELHRRACKGVETRRKNERAAKRAKAAQKRAREERKRVKEEARVKRSATAKRARARRLARDRAASALETFVSAVDKKVRERELQLVKASWHKAKRELARSYGEDYERYLNVLEDIGQESGTEWDIAYGSTEAA